MVFRQYLGSIFGKFQFFYKHRRYIFLTQFQKYIFYNISIDLSNYLVSDYSVENFIKNYKRRYILHILDKLCEK